MTAYVRAWSSESALALASDANFVVVAVIATLATIAPIRIQIDAAVTLTSRSRCGADALARNAHARGTASLIALSTVHGICRKVATTVVSAALGLSLLHP